MSQGWSKVIIFAGIDQMNGPFHLTLHSQRFHQILRKIFKIWRKNLNLISKVVPRSTAVEQWGSVTHQMAVPVPSISFCVLNHLNIFYQIQNALAFNQDTCCCLALYLRLLPFHWLVIPRFRVRILPLTQGERYLNPCELGHRVKKSSFCIKHLF